MGNENFDFEVRPCMLDTEDKCVSVAGCRRDRI